MKSLLHPRLSGSTRKQDKRKNGSMARLSASPRLLPVPGSVWRRTSQDWRNGHTLFLDTFHASGEMCPTDALDLLPWERATQSRVFPNHYVSFLTI